MALATETKEKYKYIKEIYVFDEEEPDEKELTYKIHTRDKEISLFLNNGRHHLDEVLITGFEKLPSEFYEKGYIKSGLLYYLDKKCEEEDIDELEISSLKENELTDDDGNKKMVLSYPTFKELRKRIGSVNYENKMYKSGQVDNFFHSIFPNEYQQKEDTERLKIKKILNSLDESIIKHLKADETSELLEFYDSLLRKRYDSKSHKKDLISSQKIKVDEITINQIISELESKLESNPSESKWGDFLQKNLFLVDSKYVASIPELNVVLAGARNMDFGLVDSKGYLDIFEIKKPSTTIISSRTDRGNYYWSTKAVKALTQAEKYLFNAERKASSLTEDIRRQKGISVKVIKPRAIVLMGSSDQLDNDDKKEDFRILRRSLKNIEIVLYDELLESLKNQKNKIYTE